MPEKSASAAFAADAGGDNAGFTQVRTKRGYEYILEQIREAIISGRFKPGDRLPAEREMAQIFGVSRHAVREALRGLESTGLVEIRLGVLGGIYVRDGDPSTVTRAMADLASLGTLSPKSLLEARILLTSNVIRLACERATEEDFRRIEDDIVMTEQHVTKAGVKRTAQITEFYHALAAASHNEVLVMLTDSLAQLVHARINRAEPKPDREIGKVRRRILDHMRAGRADEAIDEMTRHLTALEDTLLAAERRKKPRAAEKTSS
jgi:DNA-binding FadR family transcriptional regulator